MSLTIDIENFLAKGLADLGIDLENQAAGLSRLLVYFHELQKWNSKVNLVARSQDDKQILENHFLDSLSLLRLLPAGSLKLENLLDIGTGAGFPGLVLGATCPSLSITLIEPRKNRYYFLKHVARTLDLHNVTVLNMRLEEKHIDEQLALRRYSFITSRAFTDISGFTALAAPYLAKEGRIVCMKSAAAESEMKDFQPMEINGTFAVTETVKLQLPYSGAARMLVVIRRSVDEHR